MSKFFPHDISIEDFEKEKCEEICNVLVHFAAFYRLSRFYAALKMCFAVRLKL
jgi:hypothetical protein